MKTLLKYIAVLLIVAFANTMQAQEADSTRYQEEIKSLNDSIERMDKVIRQLTAELEGYHDSKISAYKKENEKLLDSIGRLNDIIKGENAKITGLEKENERLADGLEKVSPLVERQLKEMSSTVDQEWLSKSFSDIDKDVLQEELKLYEAFKDKKGVGEAHKKLSAFADDYSLYMQGIEAINKPYQADVVASLIGSIKTLKGKEKHDGRKAELEQLYDQLSYYQATVMYCQEVIGEVDNMLDSFKADGTDKSAWKQIKMFLDAKDEGQVESSMNLIPWIGARFQEYLKQLQANPYGANTAREVIMNLVP